LINKEGFPDKGELVLCTVTRLLPHAAFVKLDEYGKEGMVSLSEVSLKGVRDIKEVLSVNKSLVCKVLDVDEVKGDIDLSLKRVKQSESSKKLNDSRLETRIYKMIEYACKSAKADIKKVVLELLKEFDSLVNLYDELKLNGAGLLEKSALPINVKSALEKQFTELLEQIKVSVTKVVSLSSDKSDGLLSIKELVKDFNKNPEVSVSVKYLGAPNYMVVVRARNYKLAESAFNKAYEFIQSKAKQLNVKVGLIA